MAQKHNTNTSTDRYITHLNIPYDRDALLREMQSVTFMTKWRGTQPWWRKGVCPLDNKNLLELNKVVQYVERRLGVGSTIPMYYEQQAGLAVPEHVDTNCAACINIVLSDEPQPVVFEDTAVSYTCAVLNVNEYKHHVPADTAVRKILRLVVKEIRYKEVCQALRSIDE